MPEHDCLPPDVVGHRVRDAHGPRVRAAVRRRARADRRRPAPRRPLRGALPADRRLLDRHEAAGQAGPGARPRPEAALPRRADERPRSRRTRRDARRSSSASAASSGSPSWSPATCSARSSASPPGSMAIDAGKLLRTAPLASFTERTGQLLIETDETAEPLAARLIARGIGTRGDGRTVVVDLASRRRERLRDLRRGPRRGGGARAGARAPRASAAPAGGPVPRRRDR